MIVSFDCKSMALFRTINANTDGCGRFSFAVVTAGFLFEGSEDCVHSTVSYCKSNLIKVKNIPPIQPS